LTDNCAADTKVFSVKYDKPILLDYYNDSINNKACIGLCNNKEKIIIKSKDEYTSPIQNIFKVQNDYITVTENSIYLLSTSIKTKKLNINI
jgi:hypothetical protein